MRLLAGENVGKKMSQFGRVEIPQQAFMNALKIDG
jgi:translation elongation factor EF-4